MTPSDSPSVFTADTPLTHHLVDHFTDQVTAEIGDIADEFGLTLTCWDDLHGHVDTNSLTLAIGVPWGADVATDDDPAGVRWINAVEYAADERIHAAAGTPPCAAMADHDEPVDGLDWQDTDGTHTAASGNSDAGWEILRLGDGSCTLDLVADGTTHAGGDQVQRFATVFEAKVAAETAEAVGR